jgi:hypothetical protein
VGRKKRREGLCLPLWAGRREGARAGEGRSFLVCWLPHWAADRVLRVGFGNGQRREERGDLGRPASYHEEGRMLVTGTKRKEGRDRGSRRPRKKKRKGGGSSLTAKKGRKEGRVLVGQEERKKRRKGCWLARKKEKRGRKLRLLAVVQKRGEGRILAGHERIQRRGENL